MLYHTRRKIKTLVMLENHLVLLRYCHPMIMDIDLMSMKVMLPYLLMSYMILMHMLSPYMLSSHLLLLHLRGFPEARTTHHYSLYVQTMSLLV